MSLWGAIFKLKINLKTLNIVLWTAKLNSFINATKGLLFFNSSYVSKVLTILLKVAPEMFKKDNKERIIFAIGTNSELILSEIFVSLLTLLLFVYLLINSSRDVKIFSLPFISLIKNLSLSEGADTICQPPISSWF